MIHELIDPKKKTNKAHAWKNTKTLHDNKPFSDHCTFEPSDSENKEPESSSTTFIPPWLRNSLGLNQRHNQSNATAGHSEAKSAKVIQRYKEPIQNEFEALKTNGEEDCCKKVASQFENLSLSCPQEENTPQSTDVIAQSDERAPPMRWKIRQIESETDSSSTVITEVKPFEKGEQKLTNTDILSELEKFKDEEKKKQLKFVRQRCKLRKRRSSDYKTFEATKNGADCLLEMKAREALDCYLKKNVRAVPSEAKQLEAKHTLLGAKRHNTNCVNLNSEELRLLQDMKEQVGSVGDFNVVLGQTKEDNMREVIKKAEFLADNTGDKKVECKEERSTREMTSIFEEAKFNADKDSLLSTDDENNIKRFSEFLSKNKNVEEKRKCLEEVRNYFERKRSTRMSKRRYLEDIKARLSTETEKKEELMKGKGKSREIFTMATNKGKKSKFALCDEEVVEKAVDETLQKFVELYHFHVSPTVIGSMKKNILQAMQSDSTESGCSKGNLHESEGKSAGKKSKSEGVHSPSRTQKPELRSFELQGANPEGASKEMVYLKDVRKKNFKTLLVSSSETLSKPSKETDVLENERLKRLNKEFENFLHSVRNHIDVSNLKIQSIILERDEQAGSSKHVQFVYNFTKRGVESERHGHWQGLKELQGPRTYKETGVQASIKKEAAKKSVRIQATEQRNTSEKSLQTEEKVLASRPTQTDAENVHLREFKELKNVEINPGLYRMVRSKEAGKFYLYPEQLDEEKIQALDNNNPCVLTDEKPNRKKEFQNLVSKERPKEKRVSFKEKEKGRLKRSRRPYYTAAYSKGGIWKREKSLAGTWRGGVEGAGETRGAGGTREAGRTRKAGGASGAAGAPERAGGAGAVGGAGGVERSERVEGVGAVGAGGSEASGSLGGKGGIAKSGSSISCLYFRDFDGKNSESLQSRREFLLKKESGETREELGLGDTKEREHFGCVWFWNGEKISPGCDLKTHVEDLLVEKLREMTDTDLLQNKILVNGVNLTKLESGSLSVVKDSQKHFDAKGLFCFKTFKGSHNDTQFTFALDKERAETPGKVDEEKGKSRKNDKSDENEKSGENEKLEGSEEAKVECLSASQEKVVRNVGTQNSQQTILSFNLTRGHTQSKMTVSVPKRKHPKRTVNIGRFHRKLVSFKKAEEIIRAVEEIKKLKQELETRKDSIDSESLLGASSSTSCSKGESEDPLSMVLGLRESSKSEEVSRLKKIIGFVDQHVKTSDVMALEDPKSEHSQETVPRMESHRHLDLIENVLSRVNQKERESLWNDVREFIKAKIGRDIEDDGAREVCIEIEQDVPKNDQADKAKQAVLARRHYVGNEGDVEVEIDLTLDDLEKILRQRQKKKMRKHHMYQKKYRRFISSSSIQSDLTRDDMRKYQKYLTRFAPVGGGFLTERPSSSFKKNKGN